MRNNLDNSDEFKLLIYSYNAGYEEASEFLKYERFICQCSYEFQCLIYDFFPEWYDEEVLKAYEYGWGFV